MLNYLHILFFLYNFAKVLIMINICEHITTDNKTKEELLENVVIEKTTFKDATKIISILHNCFRY